MVSRPDVTVLGAEALVPRDNVVRPAPNRFSHVLEQDQPYWFDRAEPHPQPDGVLAAGTPVVVLREEEEGEQCRVVTGSGLYVSVDRASVGRLPHDDG
ncbi:hypothetical protein J1792_33250 [Streptomyces triculaminicus]|uniref:Uncharacterized protein n=2 Tax=Streptomyces TaxID=1883 RepID=A0A939FS20_9ACTN|nr:MULTISPECIES: hypothetical protein [Streptomyces]MBO0657406.1 hypothetical protein [Streptomyces triculaminicus]QSY49404.1 hypothetical protein J3S04_31570 [Streptomyces griseocarneus]